ncbi:MAG: PEP-CTERM sorting domain-containing protein [Verrucomicrobiales bacterium]|jgi:hypothetical protein|nr:PEP-CTERM sorting domain-containing protein [Verrucomicrobiales bacterium]
MKTPTRRLTLSAALLGALFTLGHLSPAQAQNIWTNTGTGDWASASNWSQGAVPGYSSVTGTAIIGSPGYLTGTAVLSSGSYTAIVLQLGRGSNTANGYLRVNGGTLAGLRSIEIGGAVTSYSGAKGTLEINSGLVTGTTTQVGVYGQGALLLNGGRLQTDTLTLGVNANSSGTLIIGNDGSGMITKLDGSTPTTISSGSGAGVLRFAHNGNIQFANAVTGNGMLNLGQIQLIHAGSGTTTLTGGSVSVSRVSVTRGELSVAANTTLTVNNQTIEVGSGATLSGEGVISSNPIGMNSKLLTIQSGGHIAATLVVNVGLTLETGAVLDYYGGSGLVLGDGGFEISLVKGTSTVQVDFSRVSLDLGSYHIIDYDATQSNNVATDGSQFSAIGLGSEVEGTFEVDQIHNRLVFTVTAVPEPSTYFLLGAGLGLIGFLKLRRRQQF